MSLPATPHGALFRALVASPDRVGALLKEYLPEPVAGLLDPDTPPEPMEGSFVDGDAARTQSDALFRVRLRTGHEARIYMLLEHKSEVDAATPLRILKYMINIWQREIAEGTAKDGLPPIVPLVFYHGQGRWTAARSVIEMIDAPDGLVPLLTLSGHVPRVLGEIEPLRLSRAPEVLAEGVEKGLAVGRALLVLRQLELRFGALSDAVRERVCGASASELEAWAEAVLTAGSIEEVLAAGSGC